MRWAWIKDLYFVIQQASCCSLSLSQWGYYEFSFFCCILVRDDFGAFSRNFLVALYHGLDHDESTICSWFASRYVLIALCTFCSLKLLENVESISSMHTTFVRFRMLPAQILKFGYFFCCCMHFSLPLIGILVDGLTRFWNMSIYFLYGIWLHIFLLCYKLMLLLNLT